MTEIGSLETSRGDRIFRAAGHVEAELALLSRAVRGESSVLLGPAGVGRSALLRAVESELADRFTTVLLPDGVGRSATESAADRGAGETEAAVAAEILRRAGRLGVGTGHLAARDIADEFAAWVGDSASAGRPVVVLLDRAELGEAVRQSFRQRFVLVEGHVGPQPKSPAADAVLLPLTAGEAREFLEHRARQTGIPLESVAGDDDLAEWIHDCDGLPARLERLFEADAMTTTDSATEPAATSAELREGERLAAALPLDPAARPEVRTVGEGDRSRSVVVYGENLFDEEPPAEPAVPTRAETMPDPADTADEPDAESWEPVPRLATRRRGAIGEVADPVGPATEPRTLEYGESLPVLQAWEDSRVRGELPVERLRSVPAETSAEPTAEVRDEEPRRTEPASRPEPEALPVREALPTPRPAAMPVEQAPAALQPPAGAPRRRFGQLFVSLRAKR